MALITVFQMNTLKIYAIEDAKEVQNTTTSYDESSDKIKEELSKNGNVVTQYTNEEDKKLKTIVWTKGIDPPKMGGTDSEFRKEVTHVNGEVAYVEYKAPYNTGKGWYDVNKTEDRVPDLNLCFAAAASNALHWWLAQNSNYIDQYLAKNPNYPKVEELNKLRDSFKSQQDSEVYKLFLRQFAYKKEGYWSDILEDQFINGYYPKPNGGTNDSDADREKLLTNGPDPKGGFFYDIFGTTLLTQRRNYSWNYNAFGNDLKQLFLEGNMVLMDYNMGRTTHVVSIWGVEFDLNGQISAVYLSDSDDDKSQGMVRYMVRNSGGKPVISTHVSGRGSVIENLQVLSPGKDIWEDKLNINSETSKKTLDLVWGNTDFTYNGKVQRPTVTATNIESGDDVTVSVKGEQINAGTYTATAVLSGSAANKYKLPTEHTKTFTIKKAQAKINLSANTQYNKNSNTVMLKANVSGLNGEKLDGSITFKDGDTIIASNINVSGGEASYYWTNPIVGNHSIIAEFYPSTDGIGKNYVNSTSDALSVNISKIEQSKLYIKPVTGKKFGDGTFTLEIIGGSGNGKVTYSSDKDEVISINGNTATIVGAGTATITATKLGDENYNSATATYEINIAKAPAPSITYPIASNLIYGQKLSDSTLTGGSTQYGSFAWENENIVPTVDNDGYSVIFKPNSHTLKNYETIQSTTSNVKVKVTKANPTVTLTSKISDKVGSRKVVLSASLDKVGYGDNVTGTVKFVNCTGDTDLDIEGATSVSVKNGVATYTWTGMPNKLHKIKAVYSGDKNYNSAFSSEISVDTSKKNQENFEISPIDSKIYGDKPFTLYTKGGNGNGSVKFESSDSSIISISGNVATIHKAGDVIITAKKYGDENYNEAISSIPVVVNKKVLTIKAEDKLNIIKGSPMPEFTYKVEGLVNGDRFILTPIMTTNVENTNAIGEYEITISGGNLTNSENYEIVYVNGKMTIVNKKSEAPKINGIKDTTIKVGEVDNFNLLDGITITDDYDNNLKVTTSGKIEKPSPGTNKKSTITYTVTDSDGNTTTATRVITVTNQLPVISGANKIVIKKGQSIDLLSGVKASDEEDGDITKNIVITGTVDINKEDTYKLTYTVVDSDGNTTQIERLVVVEKGDEVVPPTEELESSLPTVIVEAINNNLVNLNSGTGAVDNPFEIEFNNISDDKVDSLLSDLNNLNVKINSLENRNGYTFVNIAILRDSNSKTFRELKEEIHIVLKVKDEYENIANKLREFAKNNIEDTNDDNLNSDVDNNTDNNNNNNTDNNNNINNNTNNNNTNNNVNNDSTNSDNNKPTVDNPKTGDYVSIGMLSSLASLSLSGIILNTFGRKKNKK